MIAHVHRYSLLIIISLICLSVSAQTALVSGTVVDESGPLPYANVVLKNAADSSIAKVGITDESGAYNIVGVSEGSYNIEVSFVGMETGTIPGVTVSRGEKVRVEAITLTSKQLEEVQVTAIRPMIEIQADKTVFNVENTIAAAGTNAFELLRKAPGVIVDNNDNVILDGKTGVQIFINGKPSPLAGEDLTNFLRTMQSTDIEAIEIITQPSAKYDAAGSAGIINIRLKRNKSLGTNGSVNGGWAYGKNHRGNLGASLNNRTAKTSLYGSYNNSFGKSWNYIYLDRTQSGVRFDSESETLNNNSAQNARLGFDYFAGSKHTFGVLLDGNFFMNDAETVTNTPIIPLITGEIDQTLIANNLSNNESFNAAGNLNYRFEDTLGHELLIDLDYGRYERDNNTLQPNQYIEGSDGAIILEQNYRIISPTDIDIMTAKVDYTQNLFGGKLGFGGKYSNIRTDNTFEFYDVESNDEILDEDRSNIFIYTENINAGYINYSKRWQKWSMQLGVRAEQTVSEGDLTSTQNTGLENVKRNYLDWFPSGGLTYQSGPMSSFALNYSRRIQRPNYQFLNPFESQLDELSFMKGNPFLQPQYTHNVKLSHTWKYRLTTSLSYSYIQDFFAQITDTLGADRNFLQTRNIANQQVWNIGISYPFDVAKWWSVYLSVNAFHSAYEGSDDKFNPIEQATLSFYAQNTFSLPAGFRFEVSGWFSSPTVWGGTYLTQSLGSLDLAVQKKFFDNRLTARIAASDILFTSPWYADMEFGGLAINGTGGWESRQIRVNLSYTFGRKEIKSARDRKTGLEEEGNRAASN